MTARRVLPHAFIAAIATRDRARSSGFALKSAAFDSDDRRSVSGLVYSGLAASAPMDPERSPAATVIGLARNPSGAGDTPLVCSL